MKKKNDITAVEEVVLPSQFSFAPHLTYCDEELKTKPSSYYRDVFRRFIKNKGAFVSFIILLILIFFTIFGPYFNKFTIKQTEPGIKFLPPRLGKGNSSAFWGGQKKHQAFAKSFVKFGTEVNSDGYFEDTLIPALEQRGVIKKIIDIRLYVIAPEEVDDEGNIITEAVYEEPTRQLTFKGKKYFYGENATFSVIIDMYKWVNYEQSEKEKGPHESTDNKIRFFTKEEYNKIKMVEDQKKITIILEDKGLNSSNLYEVAVDYFMYLEHVKSYSPHAFAFGTDAQGRDLFTVLWIASRTSLLIALIVSSINILIGIVIGAVSGYFGGWVDLIIERLSEIISGIPFLALLTILMLRFGNSLFIVVLAFTLTGWLGIAGLTRAQFYRYKNREYVLAAKTLGASNMRIMFKHIFPSTVGTLITSLVLYIPSIIFTESTFSFLGIINYANTESIGRLLSIGQDVMKQGHTHLIIIPAIYISVLMLTFNLMGNGLRDAFNPTLRGTE